MSYRLMFWSKSYDEGTSPVLQPVEYGYDGSMTVDDFSPDDIQEYLKRMDCIFGPCIVEVVTLHSLKSSPRTYTTYRTDVDH